MTEEITKPFQANTEALPPYKPEDGSAAAFLRGARHAIWPAATGLMGGYSQSPTQDYRLGELEASVRAAIFCLSQGTTYGIVEAAKKILEAAVAPKL